MFLSYEIQFIKRTAKLSKEDTKAFATTVLKEFGGLALLSNTSVSSTECNKFTVNCEKDAIKLVEGALVMCGCYKEIKCAIREQINKF